MTVPRAFHALLLCTLTCSSAWPAAAAGKPPAATLVIRIHDYARMPGPIIEAAKRFVNDTYHDIGVDIDWAETMRLEPDRPPPSRSQLRDPRELILVILNDSMVRRRPFPADVIGTAAITPEEGGSVGYVLADRLWQLARYSDRDTVSLMGLVMTHELGHLLLPMSAHSPTGVMRAHWRMEELQHRTEPELLRFTSFQAAEIRDFLEPHGE